MSTLVERQVIGHAGGKARKTMTAITDDDRMAIDAAPALMLAEWWCLLNKWGWPADGLGEPDPMPDKDKATMTRRSAIMNEISGRIGMRECLREWNRDTMPGEQFDAWWCSDRWFNVRANRETTR